MRKLYTFLENEYGFLAFIAILAILSLVVGLNTIHATLKHLIPC